MTPAERARRQRHRVFMDTYYMARHADLLRMEIETGGYASEEREWREVNGHPLFFKRYLVETAGCPR